MFIMLSKCVIMYVGDAYMKQEYISIKEFARLKGRSEQWATNQCRKGFVEGAVKVGKSWKVLFKDQEKYGITNQKPVEEAQVSRKLPLPVGVSDYCRVERECYYVDKTLLIKDLLWRRFFW